MDRRDFLKTVAITGAAMTIQRSEAMEILTQTINKANGDKPDLVAVMGGEPEAMFRRAISELGGMKQFIKPGQKVVVKPNIGWDKVPELAGNTNPKLITEIIKQCFAAGAKEVTVFDHTCDDWQKCYKNSAGDKREECSRRNFGDKRAAGRRPGHKGRRAFPPLVPGDRQEAQRLGYPHIQRVLPAPRSRRQRNYLGRYSLDKQARTATRTDLIRLRRKFPLQRCQGSCFPAAQ